MLVLLACFLAACSASSGLVTPTIVLVHGAYQDSSTWRLVAPLLVAKGFDVINVNLPGRSSDGADPRALTATVYRDAVLRAMDESGKGWFVVVGHSFGGITITNVGESAASRIQALVYLSALLPQAGDSGASLSAADETSVLHVPGNVLPVPLPPASPAYLRVRNDSVAADAFANDANATQTVAIVASVIPEPVRPFLGPAAPLTARFHDLLKIYIRTARDHTVTPTLQDAMIRNATNVRQVFSIDAGHASYITQPDAVARAICDAIELTNSAQAKVCIRAHVH